MSIGIVTHSDSKRAHPRRWRSVLAALISLALVLSFFHNIDGDDGIVTVAARLSTSHSDVTRSPPP